MSRPVLYMLPGLLCDETVFAPQVAGLSDICEVRTPEFRGLDLFTAMAQRVLDDAPAAVLRRGLLHGRARRLPDRRHGARSHRAVLRVRHRRRAAGGRRGAAAPGRDRPRLARGHGRAGRRLASAHAAREPPRRPRLRGAPEGHGDALDARAARETDPRPAEPSRRPPRAADHQMPDAHRLRPAGRVEPARSLTRPSRRPFPARNWSSSRTAGTSCPSNSPRRSTAPCGSG